MPIATTHRGSSNNYGQNQQDVGNFTVQEPSHIAFCLELARGNLWLNFI